MHRNRVSGSWLLAGVLLLSGCTTVKSYWPFGKPAAPAPQPVSELALQLTAGDVAPVLQFWERNALVLDLQNVATTGQAVLVRRTGNSWPARISVRMAPQRFEVLELRGAQRLLLPVAASPAAVTAELPPGILDPGTQTLTLRWGAKGDF